MIVQKIYKMCVRSFLLFSICFILFSPAFGQNEGCNLSDVSTFQHTFPEQKNQRLKISYNDSWIGKDKADHFLVSTFLLVGNYYILREEQRFSKKKALCLSAGLSLSVGIGKEISDGLRKNKVASLQDLVVDILGIGAGILLYTRDN